MKHTRPVIPEILSLLANACSTLKPTPEMAAVWDSLLAKYPDDSIRKAAVHVAKQVHFGAPTVGHIVEAIEGKLTKVRVQLTDLYGRGILREDGTPAFEMQEVRMLPDGTTKLLPEADQFEDERIGPTGNRGRWVNPNLWIDNRPHGPELAEFGDIAIPDAGSAF